MSVPGLRALVLIQQERFELAEQELGQALIASPDDAILHSLLATCLLHRKAYVEATREAEVAVHLAPTDPFAHYTLASVMDDRDRLSDAQRSVAEAIRLDPHDADSWALSSNIRFQQKAWTEALEDAERGLAVDAEHVACNNLRAMALVKLGRSRDAGATIDAVLARCPEDALSHANQGWTLLEQGATDKALEHFRESLRLDPNLDWARQGLVEALKARYLLYGLLLKYFLWMSKLRARAQFGVILGGYFGFRMLRGLVRSNPGLAVWVWPLELAYIAFVWLTWLADPLFNLLLRLNRFGRLALSDEQRRSSNLVGGSLLLGILSLAGALATQEAALWVATGAFAFLMLPLSAVHRCDAGWPRTAMTGYTLLLALIAAGAIVGMGLRREFALTAISLFMIGIFLNGFVANGLIFARVKR